MFAIWLADSRRPSEKTRPSNRSVDDLTKRVLAMFEQLGKDALDLHQLFEAGGNDPQARAMVLEIVERLVRDGLLEERGNDFYSLSDKGKLSAQQVKDSGFQN